MSTQTAGSTTFNPGPETYERELVPRIFGPWASRLVDLAAPRTGERVLDVACGTGIVARTAAARVGPGGTIVGYDLNPGMLDVARQVSAEQALRIEWEQGDGVALPYGDASFDVVFCQQGLQFFSDRVAGLKEMRRVTAPRGRVALAVWRGADLHATLDAFGQVLSKYLPAEMTAGIDAPFLIGDVDQVRGLFKEAGFTDAHVRVEVGSARYSSPEEMIGAIGGAYAPMAAAIDALEPDARAALIEEITHAIKIYLDDDGVIVPMISSVVLAHP